MRFWDTSAIVPLLVGQPATPQANRWVEEDPALVIWTLTPVEITSAMCRLHREAALPRELLERIERATDDLTRAAHTVVALDAVHGRARRALRVHPLRAADALQLGAAIEWAEGRPSGHVLHTLDVRLAQAARAEGFLVP